jgi:RNA polymerase sigma-70 factor (ECF subfamily)
VVVAIEVAEVEVTHGSVLPRIISCPQILGVGRWTGTGGGPVSVQGTYAPGTRPRPRGVITLFRIERGEEGRLLGAARNGDKAALEILLRDQYDGVYALCHRLTGNEADAADATQEAMISIVRGLRRFDGRSAFSTWTYRIAYNASVDLLRARTRRKVSSIGHEDAPEPWVAEDVAGPIEERLDVGAALQRLPVDFRGPVVLRDLCGLNYSEIGEVLRIPPGTVRSRIARGRAMLVESMQRARTES